MDWARLILEYIQVFIWPILILIIVCLFREQIRALLSRIKKADLPGGVSIDFQEEIEKAQEISEKVEAEKNIEKLRPQIEKAPTLPLTEANARMIQVGLRPSPSGLDLSYYRNLASQDSTLALAGLRIELDILVRNVALGFKVDLEPRESTSRLIRRLCDAGAVTMEQTNLVQRILHICNSAIHEGPISMGQANSVLDSAEVLVRQYIEWLSWGFDDNWAPNQNEQTT